MNMVIPQRVTPYFHIPFMAVLVDDLEKEFSIIFMERNRFPAVSSPDDEVRAAKDNNTSDSVHFVGWIDKILFFKKTGKYVLCPQFIQFIKLLL